MKLGYTVWTWIIRLYEENHTWEPKSARSKMDFEEAMKSIAYLGYDSAECFNQIVDIYEDAEDEFDQVIKSNKLSFDCIYIYITDDFETDKKNAEKCFRFMKRHNIPYANLQTSPRPLDRKMTEAELKEEIEKAKIIGCMGKEYGVTVCLHPHLDTHIQYEEEIEQLVQRTSKEEIALCFDTAHLEAANMDSAEMIKKYADRIAYMHLKDLAPESEMIATHFDRFRALGKGMLNFDRVLYALKEIGYDGNLCVELDNPAICNFESAQQSMKHMKFLGL
ncbi:MAG: sugar phosphate isomerase/epimerase [Lachnospiraceae bacterium]|nr:sugar phosphate isomerase/epimerase [Lachnospiraceae bacterium]